MSANSDHVVLTFSVPIREAEIIVDQAINRRIPIAEVIRTILYYNTDNLQSIDHIVYPVSSTKSTRGRGRPVSRFQRRSAEGE